jgi:GNAT superfamily N-acetyltransferase
MLDPDWVERGALAGTVADAAGERIVALGSYVRLRDPARAEVAFAVADELQGKGVGTRLLEQLADEAGRVGVECFLAEVLADNRAMLGVFESAGFEVRREFDSGVAEVTLAIDPTARYFDRVDRRDHVAVTASLAGFFAPASVAVIGASPRRGSIGGELFRNIITGDFAGAAHPVNPDAAPVSGVRAYASIADVPPPVDLAVIAVPAERGDRGGRGGPEHRGAGAVRHLGRLRLDRGGGRRAPGPAAHAGALARRPADRPQLPRDRRVRPAAERHLRPVLHPRGQHRGSRRRAARSGSPSSRRPRRVGSACRRSSRSATRRT